MAKKANWYYLENVNHDTKLSFDPKICCVTAGAAGDYYARLQKLAKKTRIQSNGKITIDLSMIAEGYITLRDNPAISNTVINTAQVSEKVIEILRDALPTCQ